MAEAPRFGMVVTNTEVRPEAVFLVLGPGGTYKGLRSVPALVLRGNTGRCGVITDIKWSSTNLDGESIWRIDEMPHA